MFVIQSQVYNGQGPEEQYLIGPAVATYSICSIGAPGVTAKLNMVKTVAKQPCSSRTGICRVCFEVFVCGMAEVASLTLAWHQSPKALRRCPWNLLSPKLPRLQAQGLGWI